MNFPNRIEGINDNCPSPRKHLVTPFCFRDSDPPFSLVLPAELLKDDRHPIDMLDRDVLESMQETDKAHCHRVIVRVKKI